MQDAKLKRCVSCLDWIHEELAECPSGVGVSPVFQYKFSKKLVPVRIPRFCPGKSQSREGGVGEVLMKFDPVDVGNFLSGG